MPTVVYKFRLLRSPLQQADVVADQMRLAHRYYNKLVEIERERRDEIRAVLKDRDPPELAAKAAASTQARAEAEAELKAQRARTRSRSVTKAQRARVKDLRKQELAAGRELRAARKDLKEDPKAQRKLKEATERATEKRRAARAVNEVFWGTYLIIEAAVDQAAKTTTLWHYSKQEKTHVPNRLKFRRWRGEGSVAVQIQGGGLPVANAFACTDRRLQIELVPFGDDRLGMRVGRKRRRHPLQDPTSNRGQRRRNALVRLRVGSAGRDPIWAEWPVLMHRPLPRYSVITWAKVTKKRVADNDRWELHLTVKGEREALRPRNDVCGVGAVAVDIGWRLFDNGLRVAYAIDEHGTESEERLIPGVLSGLRKVEDLASIRDKRLNELQEQLVPWLKAACRSQVAPEEFRERVKTISQWRPAARFAALLKYWATARWPGDAFGFDLLNAWRCRDLHLWRWQAHQRDKSLARRKHQYRNYAARMARRYRVLVIEHFNLADTQKHHDPEDEKPEIKAARQQQRDAACYELRECLVQAFRNRGGKIVRVPAAMTTQRCFGCGCEDRWDAAPQVMHTCVQCGRTWDQDANAARNILQAHREGCGTEPDDPAEKRAKWHKRHAGSKGTRKTKSKSTETKGTSGKGNNACTIS